jgi:hypothetical protein
VVRRVLFLLFLFLDLTDEMCSIMFCLVFVCQQPLCSKQGNDGGGRWRRAGRMCSSHVQFGDTVTDSALNLLVRGQIPIFRNCEVFLDIIFHLTIITSSCTTKKLH